MLVKGAIKRNVPCTLEVTEDKQWHKYEVVDREHHVNSVECLFLFGSESNKEGLTGWIVLCAAWQDINICAKCSHSHELL